MSTNTLRNAVDSAVNPGAKPSLPALLEKMKPQLALALPKHMNPDRMVRIALTELRKAPKLMECDPQSVIAAVVIGSQLGLEPGIAGQAYLIPYNGQCQFVPGWKGLVDLAQRSGRASVWTGAVFEGDDFEYEYGSSPYVKHKPGPNAGNPRFLQMVYAVGRVRGAEFPVIEVWSMEKAMAHRDRFNKVGKRHYSYEHPEMYARKVALLQVLKYMPSSIELATAMDLDHAAEGAKAQNLNMADALAGEFVAVPDPEPETPVQAQQESPQHSPIHESAAILMFKHAKTTAEITAIWKDIVASYAGAEVPVAIEAARNTYRDLIADAARGAGGGK